MNKSDLIDAIYDGVSGLTKAKSEETLNVTLSVIIDAVAKGETLNLVGFGAFYAADRSARVAHNPRTGEKVKVRAAKTARFRASKKFKDAVNA